LLIDFDKADIKFRKQIKIVTLMVMVVMILKMLIVIIFMMLLFLMMTKHSLG